MPVFTVEVDVIGCEGYRYKRDLEPRVAYGTREEAQAAIERHVALWPNWTPARANSFRSHCTIKEKQER